MVFLLKHKQQGVTEMYKVVDESGVVAYEGGSFGAAVYSRKYENEKGGSFKIVNMFEIQEDDYLNGDSALYDDHPPLN
jgi:hypothetical protein